MKEQIGGGSLEQGSVIIELTEKKAKIVERRILEREAIEKRLQDLDRMHRELETMISRSTGKVDGLVESIVEEEGYDATKLAKYQVDTDSKKLIITFQKEELAAPSDDSTPGSPEGLSLVHDQDHEHKHSEGIAAQEKGELELV